MAETLQAIMFASFFSFLDDRRKLVNLHRKDVERANGSENMIENATGETSITEIAVEPKVAINVTVSRVIMSGRSVLVSL